MLLSFIEFSINGQQHSATGHSPFFLMYGYEPSYGLDSNPKSVAPAADERLTQMKKDRDDVIAALLIAADRMKDYHDRNLSKIPNFKPGNLVWLDARNLQRLRPSWKLAHRRLGPFKVKRAIGRLNYELELPPSMKIHPVFYVGFLQPAPQSTIPGRTFPEPPPILVDNEEEFEVENILDSRIYRG